MAEKMQKTVLDIPQVTAGERWVARAEKFEVIKMPGWQLGNMGVYENGDVWAVMHVPSGSLIHPAICNLFEAQWLMEVLGELLPAEGVLGESPALRMTAAECDAARQAFASWLDKHGYNRKGATLRMAGEPAVAAP